MSADLAPLRRHRRGRLWLQVACLAVTAFMAVPLYLIALAAVSSRASLNTFPLPLLPTNLSFETLGAFLSSTGVVPSFGNSLIVGFWTLVLSLLIGVPRRTALARTRFAVKSPTSCSCCSRARCRSSCCRCRSRSCSSRRASTTRPTR